MVNVIKNMAIVSKYKATVSNELWEHLKDKGKKNIVVEVATSETSDFDVSEIFIRTCTSKHREYLVEKKKYREVAIDGIDPSEAVVLLPNYRMEVEDEIFFDLKKFFIFNRIVYSGVKL